MNFFEKHFGVFLIIGLVIFAVSVIAGFGHLIERDDNFRRKQNACKRVVEVGVGSTFTKHNAFHMQTCIAGLDQVERDFAEANEPDIAKAFFECLAVGESEEDFEFCHEFKSRRLFQEHYRLSREEADKDE